MRWWCVGLSGLLMGCFGVADGPLGVPSIGLDGSASEGDGGGRVDAGGDAEVDAGLDAGLGDAGSDGGGSSFFGASRCRSGALVCDGFEATALDASKWTYYPPGGGATGYAAVDDTKAARGSRSLHLHSGVQVRAKDDWAFLANGFYLRAFMWWGQAEPDWHLTYFWVIDPAQPGAFTLGSYHNQLGINEYGPNNGDTGVAARDVLPVGRWACVEWHVKPNTNEVHVWMDEAEVPAEPQNPFQVPNMHVTTWPPMNWKSFTIEFITAQKGDDLWIDELAIDTQRIGCRD